MKKYSLILLPFLTSFSCAEDFVIDMRDSNEHLNVKNIENNIKKDIIEDNIKFYKDSLNNKKITQVAKVKDSYQLEHNDKQLVYTQNKLVSHVLKKIAKFKNKTYILNGQDFIIEEGYKISNLMELKEVIKLVSDYKMEIVSTNLKDTSIIKVRPKIVARKLTIEAKLDFISLKQILLKEFDTRLILTKAILSKKLNVHLFGTYSLEELVEDMERQSDVWFIKRGNKLYAEKTKEMVFDLKRNGKFAISFSNGSSSDTGSSTGGGGTVSTGFDFSLEDKNKEEFLDLLKNNFPNITFKSSDSGFVLSTVTPSQFLTVTEYFKNIDDRYELISGEIVLLALEKRNNSYYDIGWENLLLNKDLLKAGSNGTLFLDSLNVGSMTKNPKFENTSSLTISGKGTEPVGFIQALQGIGNVSIVDKWVISTATGIPTGFTNYQKIPYFTKEQTGSDIAATSTDFGGVIEKFTVNYALTGFKSTFSINKTSRDSYIIDGAIDYSNIDKFEEREDGSKAPYISGKSMRIYTEFEDLDKTIVIGGFKNLSKEVSTKETPFLSKIPFLGWLFSSDEDTDTSKEFIILIKLKKPTQLDNAQKRVKYKVLKELDKTIDPFEKKEINKKMKKESSNFKIFED